MRLSLLAALACPACGGELKFAVLDAYPSHDQRVDEATLGCKRCPAEYPVAAGVPRLTPAGAKARTLSASPSVRRAALAAVQADFLDATCLAAEDLAGKLTLDAGGPPGRRGTAARALGAEVVVLESDPKELAELSRRAEGDAKLHPVEGALERPPFKPGVFDAVWSLDAVSAEADPRAAFASLCALVKTRGALSVRLRGAPGAFAQFATNPLAPGSEGVARHRRAAWLWLKLKSLFAPGGHTKEDLARWFHDEGFVVHRTRPHGLVPEPTALGRKGR